MSHTPHIVHAVGTWIPFARHEAFGHLDVGNQLYRLLETVFHAAAEGSMSSPVGLAAADRDSVDAGLPWRGAAHALIRVREAITRVDDDRDRDGGSPPELDLLVGLSPWAARHALQRLVAGLPATEVELPELDMVPGVVLHVRSVRYEERQHLHVGISAWPRLPPAWAETMGIVWETVDADPLVLAAALERVGEAWVRCLDTWFPPSVYTIGEMEFQPPGYWFVSDELLDDTDPVGRAFLEQALKVRSFDNAAVDSAVMNGEFRLWRRMERSPDGPIRPLYLVAPLTGAPHPGSDGTHVRPLLDLVRVLHELEGHIAAALSHLQTDLELDNRLLRTYQSAATEGSALWDRLAMHLPSAKEARLNRAYKQVLLIHLTLLQSVSDLQNLTMHIEETKARIERSITTVEWRFDQELEEEVGSPERTGQAHTEGIRSAIVRTGLSRWVKHGADDTTRLADRVNERTTRLFMAVAAALDGRRARQSDVIQRFAIPVVAIAAGVELAIEILGGGLLFSTDFLEILGIPTLGLAAPWQAVMAPLVVTLVAIVAVGGLAVYIQDGLTRGRRLGRGALYRDLETARNFLSACSSERLDWEEAFVRKDVSRQMADHANPDPRTRHERERGLWREIDQEVVAQYATIWDRSVSGQYVRRQPKVGERGVLAVLRRSASVDLNRLQDRVGRWAIQSMLLTERPRRFDHYQLVRLCLLMRHIRLASDAPTWMAPVGSFRTPWFDTLLPPVTKREATLVLMRHFPGLSPAMADQWDHDLRQAVVRKDETGRASEKARGATLTATGIAETVEAWIEEKTEYWAQYLAVGDHPRPLTLSVDDLEVTLPSATSRSAV